MHLYWIYFYSVSMSNFEKKEDALYDIKHLLQSGIRVASML